MFKQNHVTCFEIIPQGVSRHTKNINRRRFFCGCFLFFFQSLQINMSTIFLYEDGCGNVIDENGGPEPMDYIVDQNEFIVETIATHSEYLKHASSSESSRACPMLIEKPKDEDIRMKEANVKRIYVRYTIQDKVRFFDWKIEKCMSASASAKQLGIHIRTA